MSSNYWYLREITAALDASASSDESLLADAAIGYSEACHEANDRLSRVASLLRKGLRGEAIELAERETPLLDHVAKLDFPRRGEWVALLDRLIMTLPPELDIEAAAELNQAYAASESLDDLMKKHRLLAIGRAPLAMRLRVLRKLRQRDADNPAWAEDVESYETARLDEIKRELGKAARSGIAQEAEALYDELHDKSWSVALPAELLKRASDLKEGRMRDAAREELGPLASQVDAAYNELDEERMAGLADAWRKTARIAELTPDDPLSQRVQPALEWSDERLAARQSESAFWGDVASLEALLDTAASDSAPQVSAALQALKRHEYEIPELVKQRAEDLLTAHATRKNRRALAIASVSTLAVTAVLTLGGLAWWRSSYETGVAKHASALEQLLTDEDLTTARAYADSTPESMRGEPQIERLLSALDSKELDDKNRHAEYLQRIEATETAAVDELSSAELKSIEKLAKTDEERSRLEAQQLRYRSHLASVRQENDNALSKAMEDWAPLLASAEKALEEGVRIDRLTAQRLLNEMPAALNAFGDVSSRYSERRNRLVQKAVTLTQADRKFGERRDALRVLLANPQNVKAYVQAASRHATRWPDAPEALALKQLPQQASALASILRWSELWDKYGGDVPRLQPEQAETLLTEGDALLQEDQALQHPLNQEYKLRKEHFARVTKRVELLDRLEDWLGDLPFTLWVVEDEGKIRYCPVRPKTTAKGSKDFTYRYFSDALGSLNNGLGSRDDRYYESPLRKLTDEVHQGFRQKAMKNWDATFHEAIVKTMRAHERLVETGEGVHPIGVLDLFRRLLAIAKDGSVPSATVIEPYLDQIQGAPIDFTTAWYGDEEYAGKAANQKAALKGMPRRSRVEREFRRNTELFRTHRKPLSGVVWIGVVDATRPGATEVVFRDGAPDKAAGDLVVAKFLTDQEVEFQVIGSLINGEMRLGQGTSPSTGALVFLHQVP